MENDYLNSILCLSNDRYRWIPQLCIAMGVVFFMLFGTYLSQQLQQTFHYQHPMFLTWFSSSFLCVLLFGQFLLFLVQHLLSDDSLHGFAIFKLFLLRLHQDMSTPTTPFAGTEDISLDPDAVEDLSSDTTPDHAEQVPDDPSFELPLSDDQAAYAAARTFYLRSLLFSLFWMLANYFFMAALSLTVASSVLTLEQAATIFVFLFSICYLHEPVTFFKVLAVGTCIGGVIIFEFATSSQSEASATRQTIGCLLMLVSTLFTALYLVFTKRFMSFQPSLFTLNCLLGLIGVNILVFYWPLVLIANYTGLEPFAWPDSTDTILLFFGNAASGLCFNYLLNFGIIIVTPLYMRIAILFSVPISYVIDIFVLDTGVNFVQLAGAFFIVLGFIGFLFTHHFETIPVFSSSNLQFED